MTEYYVGEVSEFPENQARSVDVGGIDVAVCHVDGEFYGISNLCTHKNYSFTGTPNHPTADTGPTFTTQNGSPCIECPWHYLKWNLETGNNNVNHQSIGTFDVEVRDESVYVLL